MSSSILEEHRKAYEEQKRLEKYQRTRVLPRPNTTKVTVALHLILLPGFLGGFGGALFAVSSLSLWWNLLIFALVFVAVIESYGRLVAVKCVECYQHYASEKTRRKCKCVPSCSEYAILCLKKYEFLYALWKIRKRLFVTCQGFDWIVDNP